MQLVAGIASLDIPQRFANARRRILLHAAVYGPFASSASHSNALAQALDCPSFERLDIIALSPDNDEAWDSAFLSALRFGTSLREIKDEVVSSWAYLKQLAASHPGKVHLHPASQLPCFPTLIIDDTIIFGQYAHAIPHAPQGFWNIVTADVEKMIKWAIQGHAPVDATAEELAAYRIINDCFQAMQPTTAQS